jgi:hypothetical protein
MVDPATQKEKDIKICYYISNKSMTTATSQCKQLSNNGLHPFKSENNELLSKIFTFDGKQVTVLGTPKQPLFVGKETCQR